MMIERLGVFVQQPVKPRDSGNRKSANPEHEHQAGDHAGGLPPMFRCHPKLHPKLIEHEIGANAREKMA